MITLQASVGSASYGLKIEGSDTDVYIIGSGSYMIPDGYKPHIIKDDAETCVSKVFLERQEHPFFLQILFPHEFLLDTAASQYILETREKLIQANLKKVYNAYLNMGKGFLSMSDILYYAVPKRIAYGNMFLDTIYKYAQGCSFEEAYYPNEDFRQWLLKVRRKEIPLEEILLINNERIKLAESVKNFYDKENDNKYIDTWRKEMLELLVERERN